MEMCHKLATITHADFLWQCREKINFNNHSHYNNSNNFHRKTSIKWTAQWPHPQICDYEYQIIQDHTLPIMHGDNYTNSAQFMWQSGADDIKQHTQYNYRYTELSMNRNAVDR